MEVLPDQEETVGSYLSSWLQHSKTRVRAKTYEGYAGLVRLYALPRIGHLRLPDLSPLLLQRLYADLLGDPKRRLSGGTILNLHLVLTQAFSQAVRWGVMASNPASGAQPPRPKRAELCGGPASCGAALGVHIRDAVRAPSRHRHRHRDAPRRDPGAAPEQILTDNAKVFTRRLAHRPTTVAFDRICLHNGIRHLLTAPYSPTTTGKIERLHKTMRKELFDGRGFASIEKAQTDLDAWVVHYNLEREHQAIGDVAPIRRFDLFERVPAEVLDPDAPPRMRPRPARTSSVAGLIVPGASASSSIATTWVGTSPGGP
jgi:integrase-like protein